MTFENSHTFAKNMDAADVFASYRSKFHIPQVNGKDCLYFTGNSLGLQPIKAKEMIEQELKDWKEWGVEGHFHAMRPWFSYHHLFKPALSRLVGAKEHEVVAMNNLSVNLHLLFVSFYRPSGKRTKIVMEAGAFPSDMYMVESHLQSRGLSYDDHVIEVVPRKGEYHLRTEDIISTIQSHGEEVAVVFFSGIQYYTGQYFDIKSITAAAHEVGAYAGFDLAHAIGNKPMELHQHGVDFAAWCSYKYLNSGPGSVSGIFIHEKHGLNPETPRFAGWWGYDEKKRFKMEKGFIPEPGVDGWQLSNAPVFSMAPHLASLEIFDEAGIYNLSEKSNMLTSYLEFCITSALNQHKTLKMDIITPPLPHRGAQLSLLVSDSGKKLFDYLSLHGVIADWREPNVIRVAPTPLYNTFEDVFRFGQLIAEFT
jgi:kynureninase